MIPAEMNERGMARADLITGVTLFALSIAVMVGALTMDRLEARRIHPFSAPGVTPGLLGLALAVVSAILVMQAVRKGGLARFGVTGSVSFWREAATVRLIVALGLCLFYALVLVGTLAWLVALVASLVFRGQLESAGLGWLVWASVTGLALGVIGLIVVLALRARAARQDEGSAG